MNTIQIVVEGNRDALILSTLLADCKNVNLRFRIAEGKNAAHSLARTLQVQFHEPVALILDADTNDAAAVEEQQVAYTAYLRFTSQGVPFTVFLMVPTIEIIFFNAPEILEKLLGKKLTERDLAVSEYAPRLILDNYLQASGINMENFIARLQEQHLQILRNVEPILALRRFLQSVALRKAA
ncbi:MAG: hypothetical protein DYG89_16805 [Caldilinea sp. CFX5]|nr:hypothetical protein [Caldilinea sp. CFX5]